MWPMYGVVLSMATAAPPVSQGSGDGVGLLVEVLFVALGGLGIFLLGMRYMSEGTQAIAGRSLRRMIALATDNRFLAVGTGTVSTCLIQSSSITTVLVVGFVNSGLMALHQALGVVMGANIGTTITGWILVIKVGKYGLPILGAAAFVYLFGKRERLRYIAMAIMGIGMIFFGLELMKNGFKPIRGEPAFMQWFEAFQADSYFGVLKCALVGCVLTMIVQSSSATLGITIGLACTGVIPFTTAAALVLGENIGTTITAWLASLGATTNAKRAAYGHMLFNIVGVIWITAIFQWYIEGVSAWVEFAEGHDPRTIAPSDFPENSAVFATVTTFGIASVHTGFNVANMILFLPFVRRFSRLLEVMVQPKRGREQPHLSTLDVRMLETPVVAIEQSRAEVNKMAMGVTKMMRWSRRVLFHGDPNEQLEGKIFHREEILDVIQREVVAFLTDLLSGSVPHRVAEEARIQLRIAHEFESISDLVAANLKTTLKMRQAGVSPADEQWSELGELHQRMEAYLGLVIDGYREGRPGVLSRAHSDGSSIVARIKDLRDRYLQSLSVARVEPLVSLSYTTLLQNYRRIGSHGLNVAEALAGEK